MKDLLRLYEGPIEALLRLYKGSIKQQAVKHMRLKKHQKEPLESLNRALIM
jgi:hypothetical protein